MLRFSDGMEIDTSGPKRIIEKSDGFYVVGDGMLIPVRDRTEGKEYLYFKTKRCDSCQFADVCLASTTVGSIECREVPLKSKFVAILMVRQSMKSFPSSHHQERERWLKCEGCKANKVCEMRIEFKSPGCKDLQAQVFVENKSW